MLDSPSSDAPILPWLVDPRQTLPKETLTDPVSGVSITLPRYNSLTVNEILFLSWAAQEYKHLNEGLNSSADVVKELKEFCHRFICLRLKLASWDDGTLLFAGEPLTSDQTMLGGDGQLLPVYVMYLVYGFAVDEESRFLGKRNPDMVGAVLRAINLSIGELSGENSTGNSNELTQDSPNSAAQISATAPRTSRSAQSKISKKVA